jgi:hypothetical protein
MQEIPYLLGKGDLTLRCYLRGNGHGNSPYLIFISLLFIIINDGDLIKVFFSMTKSGEITGKAASINIKDFDG